MALEDFEKSLVQEEERERRGDSRQKHRHKHREHGYERSRHDDDDGEHHHRHKRRKYPGDNSDTGRQKVKDAPARRSASPRASNLATSHPISNPKRSLTNGDIKRDSWMQEPSALDVDYTQRGAKKVAEPAPSRSSKADFELKIHDNELNKHYLQHVADEIDRADGDLTESNDHNTHYVFGDSGSSWRMTKLSGVYRRAKKEGRDLDDVAQEQYGDLRSFDDAREERIELDRRETYGDGYVGKRTPSGELFTERKLDLGLRKQHVSETDPQSSGLGKSTASAPNPVQSIISPLDQTALNKMKAQMLKAKIKGGTEAARLEAEYNTALANFANKKQPDVLILGTMENRMLTGGRKGEVKPIENSRGKRRGLVEENEDMTIDDMVREERRTRGQAGGDGERFAERIAKDGKFDNNLDYMEENANKLAKRVQKSEINLRNIAISDFQKMNRILDKCQLCHHEDTNTPPVAPIVSLATRVYLTLPTEPELSQGGACIVPVQHRNNLLECDDDEWEEVRNFMKSLTRMYHDQGRDVIFYENAAAPHRKKHAAMEVVPLSSNRGKDAPGFFQNAILTSDEEWSQHKKIIDTLTKARNGLGKSAFRRILVKEMPYFHVWFEIDGGLGHVIEDSNRWPKGDLFAREVIGGLLDKGPDVIKKQGKWNRDGDSRIDGFQKRWRNFDWTRVLTDG